MNSFIDIVWLAFALLAIYFMNKIILSAKSRKNNKIQSENKTNIDDDFSLIFDRIYRGDYREGKMKVIAIFDNYIDAYILKGLLQSVSIFTEIRDEFIGLNNYQYLSAIGGIKIAIHERDFELANELIESNLSDDVPFKDLMLSTFKCSKCGHDEYNHANWSYRLAILVLISIAVPLPFRRSRVYCRRCRNTIIGVY